ncbi:MAG: hypothetical protein ACQESF_06690 [Nanobdellota archaeon]
MGSVFYSKRYNWKVGRGRKKRPRTFKTEDKAKAYAKEQGLKDINIQKLKEDKYRIVKV